MYTLSGFLELTNIILANDKLVIQSNQPQHRGEIKRYPLVKCVL